MPANMLVRGGADFSEINTETTKLQASIGEMQQCIQSELRKIQSAMSAFQQRFIDAMDKSQASTKVLQDSMREAQTGTQLALSSFQQNVQEQFGKTQDGFKTLCETMKRRTSIVTTAMSRAFLRLGRNIAAAFSIRAVINFAKTSITSANDTKNAFLGLQSIVEGQGRSYDSAKRALEAYISDGLVPVKNAVTSYKNLAARGYGDEQILSVMERLKDAAAFGRQSSLSLGEAIESATEGLKNENSILVDNAGVTKNVSKMWADYAKKIGISVQSLTQQQKIQAEVNGILEETRFQVGDASKLSGTLSGQIARLAFDFEKLKVSFGNAIAPLLRAIIPAIREGVAWLTKLTDKLGLVTTSIFGKDNEFAAQGADAADAIGGIGDEVEESAKQAKKALAPFDELMKLTSQTAENAENTTDGLDTIGTVGTGTSFSIQTDVDTSGIEAWASKMMQWLTPVRDILYSLKDALLVLWNVTAPLRKFIAGTVLSFLELLASALKKLTDWARENPEVVKAIAEIILSFLAGVWMYNKVNDMIGFLKNLAGAFKNFGNIIQTAGLKAFMGSVAFAALAWGIIQLMQNWNKMNSMERVIGVVGVAIIAFTGLAIAIGAVQSALTMGIAAAAIVAGVVAISAAVASAQKRADSSGTSFGGTGRKFEIPPLATGAVIPPNKPFLAELGDQRNGANLEGPESLFRKIVREESGSSSEDSMILREIRDLLAKGQTVVLDTGEMVGAVTRGQRKDARRYGY